LFFFRRKLDGDCVDNVSGDFGLQLEYVLGRELPIECFGPQVPVSGYFNRGIP
jgi:hypothetical protein